MNSLKRVPLVIAWLVVLAASGLIVLEESGVLVELLRSRLAARLGPLGSGLSIDHVALRWLEPGVVVEGLTLRVPGPTPEQEEVLLQIRSAHISLAFDRERPLARLHIDGGRVRIGDRLIEGFDHIVDSLSADEGTAGREISPPPFVVTNFDAELELPDGTIFELGQASLVAQPSPIGGYQLHGRVIPTLSGAVPFRDAIYVDGKQWKTGVSVRMAVSGLSLASGAFRAPATFGALPVEEFAGELTLDATAKIDWSGTDVAVEGSVRASVGKARLAFRALALPVEELQLDLAADFELSEGRHIWEREAWSATGRVEARWAGSPVIAGARFGRDLPTGLWAHAWARAAEHPLTEETPLHLGADAMAMDVWRSLGLEGHADLRVDVRLPPPTPVGDTLEFQAPRFAVQARAAATTGDAAVTYYGLSRPDGSRMGCPIRAKVEAGTAFIAFSPTTGRVEVGLLDFLGDHGTGTAAASGLLSSPPRGAPPLTPWNMEIFLDVPKIRLDERVAAGLAGNPATADIWDTYSPSAGSLSSTWRLHSGVDTNGFTGAGDVHVENATLRWIGLPIALEGTSGDLSLLWERHATPVTGQPLQRRRPFGLTYDLSNLTTAQESVAHTGARAHVAGFVREESIWTETVTDEEARTRHPSHQITVQIDDLLLRGSDWETICRSYHDAGEQAEAFKAKGGVRVHFVGTRSHPDAPYETCIEATPNVVEVTPRWFPHRTRDLTGRLLVRTLERVEGEPPEVDTDLAVFGRWQAGGELAAHAHTDALQAGTARIFAAGVDPSNTAFKGALNSVLAAGERNVGAGPGLDPSAVSLDGRIDVVVDSVLSADAEPETVAKVFLRENSLIGENLRLDRLRGMLEQDVDVLFGSSVSAELNEHPLELRDVRVFSARTVFDERDPLLDRPRLGHDPDAIVLQSTVHLHELPLDMEHLSRVIAPEKLSFIANNPSWRGSLNLEGTRIVAVDDDIFISGTAEPHDLSVRLGAPITISKARVEIKELVFEGDRIRGWAQIDELDGEVLGRQLSDASMILTYVDGRLSVDNLSGAFEGGRLEPLGGAGHGTRKALSIGLTPPYRFDLALQMSGVEVDRLLSGLFSASIADKGRIEGGLQLRGSPADVTGITGRGWVRLEDGQLWSIPVMRELFGQLGFDRTAVFDRMRGRFEVKDGRIESSNLAIASSLLNLAGKGWLDLDGTLHFDLEARYGILDRLGPFNRFLYWLNNSLWRIVVRGDMSRPQIFVRNSFLDFLKNFPDDPPRQLPLPELSELPIRF